MTARREPNSLIELPRNLSARPFSPFRPPALSVILALPHDRRSVLEPQTPRESSFLSLFSVQLGKDPLGLLHQSKMNRTGTCDYLVSPLRTGVEQELPIMALPAQPGKGNFQASTTPPTLKPVSASRPPCLEGRDSFLRAALLPLQSNTLDRSFNGSSVVKTQSPQKRAKTRAADARLPSTHRHQTNCDIEYLGPTPQPLRAFSGFAGQQNPQNRNQPLGSARLQNSKIGGFSLSLTTDNINIADVNHTIRQWRKLGIWGNIERRTWSSQSSDKADSIGSYKLRADNRRFAACYTPGHVVSAHPKIPQMCFVQRLLLEEPRTNQR